MEKYLTEKEKIILLDNTITAYERLVQFEYHILLGHKNKISLIELKFLPNAFIHVSGISKLKDVSKNLNARNALFRELKTTSRLKQRIVNSIYFDQIVTRLVSIINLERNFLNYCQNKYVKFINNSISFHSSIDFDYFIKSSENKDNFYYFIRKIDKDSADNSYVLISTFIENNKDYSLGQSLMSLLKKVFVNILTNEAIVIYNKLN